MMIVKPIFYENKLIAWTATSTHTADTGGLLRGAAQEIFHEGICVPGLKIVEKDEFREDVFQTLTGMCRDPQYVGLDLKAMIAGNNICAKRYLGLVDKFGLKFVQLAGEKMIEDSEAKSRAKLRSMPEGTWVTRQYVTTLDRKTRKSVAQQLYCTMTKKGDTLNFDFTGTSPQTDTDHNSTQHRGAPRPGSDQYAFLGRSVERRQDAAGESSRAGGKHPQLQISRSLRCGAAHRQCAGFNRLRGRGQNDLRFRALRRRQRIHDRQFGIRRRSGVLLRRPHA
jgi:hypothetical protein